jgi:inorganic pyrophosphatase
MIAAMTLHPGGRHTEEHKIVAPGEGGPEQLYAFIEIPKGSRNKYEHDEETGHVILDRFLSSSTVYPTDYGYLIGHRGEDGDPLDCLVCVSEPTFPGCVIPVNPVALFKMRDDAMVDDKIVCVPVRDPGWSQIQGLHDLPEQLTLEVEHFFSVYKDLEHKKVEVEGWHPLGDALETIEQARVRESEL